MNTVITGVLAVAALLVGWHLWGWQGLVVAATVIAFALVLQFNRALRVLRQASDAPVGTVQSAVMFNAKLRAGLSLADVIGMTRSLGRKTADEPETYEWRDAGGDGVEVVFRSGRAASWTLRRAAG